MARPRKVWTDAEVEQFKKLCAIFCTKAEICSVMNVDNRTLDNLIADNFPDTPTWQEASELFSASGKASLRRMQFQLALDGDKTMLIFLGKNYLGQSDQQKEKEQQKQKAKLSTIATSSKFAKVANA